MQTTVTKAGNAPDLLSGILSIQVRNGDKITEQDRAYCQHQQDMLYKTLDQIDRLVRRLQGGGRTVSSRAQVPLRGERQGVHAGFLHLP